jgi:hypothetical protein
MKLEEIDLILRFLQRVDLKGAEVPAFQQAVNSLIAEAKGIRPMQEQSQDSEEVPETEEVDEDSFEEVETKPKGKK